MTAVRRRASEGEASDAEILGAVARGDLDALGALFDRYHGAVRSVVIHAGVTWADVDDAVQDTFLRIASIAGRYDGRPSARPWVLATAWRVAADRRRALRRFVMAVARFGAHAPGTLARTPEDESADAERWRSFARKVASLPEKMRAAYVLVEVQGVSCEEAAQALEIPVATVWTRLHHARKRMLDRAEGGER